MRMLRLRLLQVVCPFVCIDAASGVSGDLAAPPILWPEQYQVHQSTVVVKMLHMRECKPEGNPPKEVCKNFTRPETFAQPDVDLKHDFTNGVFERAQSMSPGAPPTVNEISFVGNHSAYEVERIFNPEVCEPINGKEYCVVCQSANFPGMPDRVAVPATATVAGQATLNGTRCNVYTDNNGTHDKMYYVDVSSGVLLHSVANATAPVEHTITHSFSGFVAGDPLITLPSSCSRT